MSHPPYKPETYLPADQDMDSTYSYSPSPSNDKNNMFLEPTIRSHHSQISVLHDELEVREINNTELDEYEFNITNELKKQIDHHKKSSYQPLPELSLKSLKLDSSLKHFKPTTPTILTKESKDLCTKLDNVDVLVNEMNQYIMNHKSQKINSDEFIINKLTEIQDNIEDAAIYIENIDKKIIESQHSNKIMEMTNIKYEKDINNLRQQLNIANNTISNMMHHQQQQQQPQQLSETDDMISRMSSMSHIQSTLYVDAQEKEGDDIKLQKQKEIKIKKQIYNNYYTKMNEFILKVTQKQYRLPLGVVEIISDMQEKLITENKQFNYQLDRQSYSIENDEKMNEIEKFDYQNKYNEHKLEIANKMNDLNLLNFRTLQLELDIMDILQNNKKNHQKVFFDKIIHSISRIFFDSDTILDTKVFDDTVANQTYYETDEYLSDNMIQILKTVPLTLSIIKLTDILLKTSNKDSINIQDLKSYMQNINNFRILLNRTGMNRLEFCQTFAVKMIHSGIVKKTKMENKITLISNIFLSIIATNNCGCRLLSEICNNDVTKFIECIILIIQNPPILNQIHISSSCKKQHKKNCKNIIMNQLHNNNVINSTGTAINSEIIDDNVSFASLIKNYYDLYSDKVQIKNLKKFEKYIQRRNIYPDYETGSDTDSSDVDISESGDDNTNTLHDNNDEGDDEEINSLMKFFNEIYSKPANLFVKCID